MPKPLPLARFAAADDLRAAIGLWTAWLAGERRASAHTIAAYGRDLALFLDFLTEHFGEPPSLAIMSALQPADFRAYLASVKKLSALAPETRLVLGAHNVPVAKPSVLPELEVAIHGVLDGKVQPQSVSGNQAVYQVGEISFRLRHPLPALKSPSGTN